MLHTRTILRVIRSSVSRRIGGPLRVQSYVRSIWTPNSSFLRVDESNQQQQQQQQTSSRILRPPPDLQFDEYGDPDGSASPTVAGGSTHSGGQIGTVPSIPSDPRMLDCILVRHGESEGNIAYNRSWEGDHSLYTGAFLKRHSSLWRLSDRGREQAKIAGEWLKGEIEKMKAIDGPDSNQRPIFRYYVSEYIRAMETAALLDIKDAKWFVEVQLRERDWGTFDIMSQKERVVRFSEETRRRDRDSLFYAPPGGESLVHVLSRVDGVLTNFNRQCANRRCIVVCHGEVMWAFRLRFERFSQLTYREMEAASNPQERIHNCQILHYSRRNPFTGEISTFFRWKRSVCPWDLSKSSNEWKEISRVEHTNESLTKHVNRIKRIYGHEKSSRTVEREKEEARAAQEERERKKLMLQQQQPIIQDPVVADELQRLKREVPVLAAAEAAAANSQTEATAERKALESRTRKAVSELSSTHDGGEDEDAQVQAAMDVAGSEEPTHTLTSGSRPSATIVPPPANSPPLDLTGVPQTTPATPPPPSTSTQPVWRPAPGWPFLSAHPRVLVLTKTPRYEHEKNASGLKGESLHAELSKLGFVSDRLVQSYVRHMEGLSQLIQALQQHAMRVIVKHVDSATRADLEGVDLILSAGGDGTMLKAAALLGFQERHSAAVAAATEGGHTGATSLAAGGVGAVPATLSPDQSSVPSSSAASTKHDQHHPAASGDSIESATSSYGQDIVPTLDSAHPGPNPAGDASALAHPDSQEPYVPIPLIGVNTDPQHSSGVLCAFSIEGPHTAERVIEHLRKSHFVWLEKSRIEITLLDKSGATQLVPQYAYNDVVVAERDPGRPIVYELTVDDNPAEIQRSSGVLVCTGTGSTAWMSNAAAIHPDQVMAVMQDIGHPATPADARQVAERINQNLVFESNSHEVEYFVREPLLPISSSAAVGRVGYQHRHGWAGRIAVRSLGWDAVISIDGINLVKLPKGTTAVLQIGKKPGASLTVLSLAGTGGQPFSRQ